jgi:hypothetical protein
VTVEVPLSRGMVALVDDEDAPAVIALGSWHASENRGLWYARHAYIERGCRHNLYLHRFLTGWPLTDHVNGDGLDCQRVNLRPATHAQNIANQRHRTGTTSVYRGVSYYRRDGRWRAYITADGRFQHLGYFPTAELAAAVYDVAAIAQWGEYARTNFTTTLGEMTRD